MKVRLQLIAVLALVILVLLGYNIYRAYLGTSVAASTFTECEQFGGVIQESYPRRCVDPATGTVFTEVVDPVAPPTFEPALTEAEARAVATQGDVCTSEGAVAEFGVFDSQTGLWRYAVDAEMRGCTALCIVNDLEQTAEFDWNCGTD